MNKETKRVGVVCVGLISLIISSRDFGEAGKEHKMCLAPLCFVVWCRGTQDR